MSTRNAPQNSSSSTPGSAFASKQSWSASRGLFILDAYPYPGVVMQDSFQNSSPAWFGVTSSGAGSGLVNTQSTTLVNNSVAGHSMQVTANASTRFVAVRKFDLTAKEKLGFNLFFAYDNPVNVAFMHFEAKWYDRDHGLDHTAAFRYNTFATRWEYLPSTAASSSGAWAALGGATTTLASGAWHNLYFDVDFLNNTYDEFFSGQVGFTSPSLAGTAILQTTDNIEAQRVELRVGVETTGSGAGNGWYADVVAMEVD